MVTVITGGAGGIGLACARRLGGEVILADLPGERLDAAAEQLRAEGIDARAIPCDVSDAIQVAALARPFRALVHTAGLAPPLATDPRAVLDVNLAGTARLLDAFEPHAAGGSVAVCIASLAGHRASAARGDAQLRRPLEPDLYERLGAPPSVLTAYSLSKRGVILECRRRAAAWGARGARIVSVSPGLVADTTIGEAAAGIFAGAYADQAAVKRAGTAKDIAGVVAFLAGEDAAYVTGCDLLVDGGVLADVDHHQAEDAAAMWHAAAN